MEEKLMTMTHLTNKAIAVTGLPEGACDFSFDLDGQIEMRDSSHKYIGLITGLPPGNWRILGFSQELTEEQWREVVQMFSAEKRIGGRRTYVSYTSMDIFDTATLSGRSLLKSKGPYVSNPLGPKPVDIADLGIPYQEWQSAQELTNPLILINDEKHI